MVFFHGIGNPRKLGTLATFLDEFDKYGSRQNRHEIGIPRNFKHKIEEDGHGKSRGLVQFRRIKKFKEKDVQVKIVRAYEGYWGDDVNEGISPISFLIWLAKILINLLRMRFSSWRCYPLYRIRSLHLVENEFEGARSREKLEALYRKFVSTQGVEKFPDGRFSDFENFLKEGNVKKQYGDFSCIANMWRIRERASLLRLSAILGFALSIILLIALNLFVLIFYIVRDFVIQEAPGGLTAVAAASATMAFLIWLVWQPFKQRISDVYFWTTYDERAKGYAIKEKRISQAVELISSVVSNPRCNDCVIVGHSLGSAIAVDAIFRLAEKAAALDLSEDVRKGRMQEFQKIKYLFLAGSPLENIFSLFQEGNGNSHRFNRIQEQKSPTLRGRLFQDTPESQGLTIINFWSRFDPISARIFSLRTPDNHRRKMIYNCESLPPGSPLPLPAHSGHFGDPECMKIIYRATMVGKYSENQLPDERRPLSIGSWGIFLISVVLILLFVQVIFAFLGNTALLILSFVAFIAASVGSLRNIASALKRNNT